MHGSVMLEKNVDAILGYEWDTTPINSPTSITALCAAIKDPVKFLSLLNRINISPISEQRRHYQVILQAMLVTLDPSMPNLVVKRVIRIWQRYENLMPDKLYRDTVQLWLPEDCDPDLCEKTPLILFRVNGKVFKSPLHFDCLMHMLSFYLDLARRRAYERLYMYQSMTKPVNQEYEERKEILHGYIGAQDMAIVQTLLEVCDGDVDKTPELLEIRKIACEQIHRMFISDSSSLLPKLVHYNAHVVINFIGEIMISADLKRRIFGVYLMAELVEQYKIPIAFAGVGLVSDVLDTLLSCKVFDDILFLLLNIVPALGRLMSASPFSASSIRQMLERIRHISLARRAFYNSLIAACASPEARLVKLIDSTLEECPKTLSVDFNEFNKPEERSQRSKMKRLKSYDDRNKKLLKGRFGGRTR